jgi:hypothetical protein
MTALRLARLDGVALLVDLGAEDRRPTASPASVLVVADLVGFLQDGAPDAASAQAGAVGARAVGLVASTRSGRVWGRPGHTDAAQHDLELRAVAGLSAVITTDSGFWLCSQGQVDLGGPAAAGPAQRMIIRFGRHPARWLGLQIPLFRARPRAGAPAPPWIPR